MRRQPITFAQKARLKLAAAIYSAAVWGLLFWIYTSFFGATQ